MGNLVPFEWTVKRVLGPTLDEVGKALLALRPRPALDKAPRRIFFQYLGPPDSASGCIGDLSILLQRGREGTGDRGAARESAGERLPGGESGAG